MHIHVSRTLITLSVLFLGLAFPLGNAIAKQKALKDRVVGTWT